jgi:hypothetical protein
VPALPRRATALSKVGLRRDYHPHEPEIGIQTRIDITGAGV